MVSYTDNSSIMSTGADGTDNMSTHASDLLHGGKDLFSASEVVMLFTHVLITTPGFLANILVAVVMARSRSLTSASYRIMLSLAISDALNNLGYGFVGIASILDPDPSKFWRHDYIGACLNCAFFCTLFHLNLISLNRYVSILHFTAYNKIFTPRNTLICVVMCWILAFIVLLTPHLTRNICFIYYDQPLTFLYDFDCPWTLTWSQIEMFFVIPSSIVLMLFCYSRIIWRIRKQKNLVRQAPPPQPTNIRFVSGTNGGLDQVKTTAAPKNKEIALATQFIIAFFFFVISESTFLTINSLLLAGVENIPQIFDLLITILFICHFSINPLIYLTRNHVMRSEAHAFLTRTPLRGLPGSQSMYTGSVNRINVNTAENAM